MAGFGASSKIQKNKNTAAKRANVDILYGQALSYHGNNRLTEAEAFYRKILALDDSHFLALRNLAYLLKTQGRIDDSVRLFKIAQAHADCDAATCHTYANLLFEVGDFSNAIILEDKALLKEPNNPHAYLTRGECHRLAGNLKRAYSDALQAMKLLKDDPRPALNMIAVLKDQGLFREALIRTKEILAQYPGNIKALVSHGALLKEEESYAEAVSSFDKALQLQPGNVEARINKAILMKDIGRIDDAAALVDQALIFQPGHYEAKVAAANIAQIKGQTSKAERLFLEAISSHRYAPKALHGLSIQVKREQAAQLFERVRSCLPARNDLDAIDLHFAASNTLHKLGLYGESSIHLQKANELKLNLKGSDRNQIINKSLWLASTANSISRVENDNSLNRYIFIVGMPRSGSTLLESILSMNEHAQDLGESDSLWNAYSEWTSNAQIQQSTHLVSYYDRYIGANKGNINLFIDKMLYNYMLTGIVLRAMPSAQVIHCLRNPLDNALSAYRAHFAKGNYYASCLRDFAMVAIHQAKIMESYKSEFGDRIYTYNYDSVVCEPRSEIGKLIDWLGWDWSDNYINPHLNGRHIRTASLIQARSPINRKSLGGWKMYRDLLAPAREEFIQSDLFQEFDMS